MLATTGMCSCLCLVEHISLEEESGKRYTNMLTSNSEETFKRLSKLIITPAGVFTNIMPMEKYALSDC